MDTHDGRDGSHHGDRSSTDGDGPSSQRLTADDDVPTVRLSVGELRRSGELTRSVRLPAARIASGCVASARLSP
jgi:hypothetical protein